MITPELEAKAKKVENIMLELKMQYDQLLDKARQDKKRHPNFAAWPTPVDSGTMLSLYFKSDEQLDKISSLLGI